MKPITDLLEKWRHEVEIIERFLGKKGLNRNNYICGHHERLLIVIDELKRAQIKESGHERLAQPAHRAISRSPGSPP